MEVYKDPWGLLHLRSPRCLDQNTPCRRKVRGAAQTPTPGGGGTAPLGLCKSLVLALVPIGWQYERPAHRLRPRAVGFFQARAGSSWALSSSARGSPRASCHGPWRRAAALSGIVTQPWVESTTQAATQSTHPWVSPKAFPRRHCSLRKGTGHFSTLVGFACSLCLPYYRHGKGLGTGGGLLGWAPPQHKAARGVHPWPNWEFWAKFWAK